MQLTSLHEFSRTPTYRIWRGESPELHRRYTVKELNPDARTRDVYLDWLAKETELLQKFAHPRLLSVVKSDNPGLVLHEDTQCTLEQLISRHGAFANEQVASVTAQCLEALVHLHSRDHAHGLLGARNVFVDPTGSVKLGDFTGYRFERDRPVTTHYPRQKYMAPEVIDSDLGRCGPGSDLYCLGFLALEMLAADQFPRLLGLEMHQSEAQRWLRWHADPLKTLGNWQELLPDVSAALGHFIDGLIQKETGKRRFATAAEALARLNQLGMRSRRALPMYDQTEQPAPAEPTTFRPPDRRLGPTLILQPRSSSRHSRPVEVAHDTPLIINARETADRKGPRERLALLACQSRDWHAYSLAERHSTRHNGKTVKQDSPVRLQRHDEVQFGDDRYLVDLILQGTGVVRGFDLRKRLHDGSGGELYAAKWFRSATRGKTVALRLLPADFGSDVEQIRRFLRAIPAAGRLRHPNIVRLYKGGRVRRPGEATWYIASELMPRGSLRDRLERRGAQKLDFVRTMAGEMAAALMAAKQHGVIHRNINPSCILFDKRHQARLGDFTLARGEVMETIYQVTRGKLLGSDLRYQSPELLLASPDITITSDIYSLGVCIYEALLGKLPIESKASDAAIIAQMSQFEWPSVRDPAPHVPEEWDVFLSRCLHRDPGERFATPELLADSIASLPID